MADAQTKRESTSNSISSGMLAIDENRLDKKPIYYTARALGDFLYENLLPSVTEEDALDIWRFFVATCCYIGVRVSEGRNPENERVKFFVTAVDDKSARSMFSLPTVKVARRPPIGDHFESVLRRGYYVLNEALPLASRIVPIPYETMDSKEFFATRLVLDDISRIVDLINTSNLRSKPAPRVLTYLRVKRSAQREKQ